MNNEPPSLRIARRLGFLSGGILDYFRIIIGYGSRSYLREYFTLIRAISRQDLISCCSDPQLMSFQRRLLLKRPPV
jgi:hypothetical protein